MAHFTKVRPGGWVTLSTLAAAEMQTLDENVYASINGDAGGTWAPSTQIAIGGSGLVVYDATLQLGDGAGQNGTLDVKDGSSLMFRSGAGILQFAGATWVLSGNTAFGSAGVDADGGAGHHVLSGGKLYVDSGAFIRIRAGGTVTMGGAFVASTGTSNTFQAGSTVSIAGTLGLAATCAATQTHGSTLDLYGDVTIKSPGTFSTEAGSTSTLGGAFTIGATGAIATTGTGSITIATGGSFVAASGSTTTINGTLAGAITRTAAVTKSGSTANDYVRCTSGADSNTTYAPTFDILFVNISVDRTYKINDGSQGQVVRLAVNGTLSTAELTVVDSDNNVLCMLSETVMNVAAKKGGHVDLVWSSGAWRVIGGYGLYTP